MTEKRFENRLDKSNVKFNTLNPTWDNEKETGLNVFEMIDELNKLSDENEQLKFKNRGLQSELEIRKADVDYANKFSNELFDKCKRYRKKNEQLKKEKEFWKSDACSLSSLNSILSNELSIAQEQGYEPSKPYKEYIASIKTEYSKFWENKIKTYNNQIKRSCKND